LVAPCYCCVPRVELTWTRPASVHRRHTRPSDAVGDVRALVNLSRGEARVGRVHRVQKDTEARLGRAEGGSGWIAGQHQHKAPDVQHEAVCAARGLPAGGVCCIYTSTYESQRRKARRQTRANAV
jgi:hypothetical protein